jgi:hypothetical protein
MKVATKSKKDSKKTAPSDLPASPSESNAEATAVERPSSARGKRNGSAPAKKAPGARSQKTGKGKSATKGTAAEPTDEQIRLRAYFIAERRHRLHLAGDASSDWVEAKRQLMSEAPAR